MVVAAQLIARVSALGADVTQAQLLGLGKASDAAQARFSALGAVAAGVLAVGLVAAGAKMAQMAGNFQQATTQLVTAAGEQRSAIDSVRKAILDMAPQVATPVMELVKGMYMVESAGFHGAAGLQVLRMAAMGARLEGADLGTVANAVTSALNAYGYGANRAAFVTNVMLAAVGQGKMKMQDMAASLKNVLPAAAAAHISLTDVAAAIATMTQQGDPAVSAATHLRQVILALEAPAKAGRTALESIGLTTQQVTDEMRKSLPGTLALIVDHLKKKFPEGSAAYNEALKNIAGGNKQLLGILELTGGHLSTFEENVKKVTGAAKQGGNSIAGWSLVQQNFNFKLDAAKAAMEAAGIKLGMVLLPALSKVLGFVTPLITKFADFAAALLSHKEAVAIFAGLLVGLLVPAIIGVGMAMLSAEIMGAPLILVILAIAAVVAGVILVIMHWGDIMKWAGGIFSWLGTKVHEIVDAIHQKLTDLKNWVGNIFSEIGKAIHDKITDAKNFVGQKFSDLGSAVHDKLTGLKNKVGDLFDKIGSTIHDKIYGAYQDVVKAGQWLYDHNTYVKKAVDFIGAYFHTLGTLLHDTILPGIKNTVGGTFDWLGTHLHDAATKIKNTVGGAFDWLGSHLRDAATNIKNWVGQRFSDMGAFVHDKVTWIKNTVGGLFDQLGTNVRNKVTDLKNAVGSKFSELGTDIQGKVKAVGDWLGGFFGGLVQQAFSWGQNLVQGFINGLGSLMSQVGTVAHNIVSTVAGWLGFHSPAKNVPESAMWGPNLMKMFVAGLKSGVPDVHAVLSTLFRPITMQVGANLTGSGTLTGTAPRYLFPLPASGSAPIVVNVQPPPLYIDSYRMAGALMPGVANQLRNRVPGMVGR